MKALLFCFFLFLVGCSQSATVLMADGKEYEVQIVNSDQDFLYGKSHLDEREFVPGLKDLVKLKKNDVVEIDHPGNVHLLVGGIFAGVGVSNGILGLIVLSESSADSSYEQFFAFQAFTAAAIYLGIGVPLGIWGWTTWDDSKAIASGEGVASQNQPRLLLLPTVLEGKDAKIGGLSLYLTW